MQSTWKIKLGRGKKKCVRTQTPRKTNKNENKIFQIERILLCIASSFKCPSTTKTTEYPYTDFLLLDERKNTLVR